VIIDCNTPSAAGLCSVGQEVLFNRGEGRSDAGVEGVEEAADELSSRSCQYML
jgi:hypothetical protein